MAGNRRTALLLSLLVMLVVAHRFMGARRRQARDLARESHQAVMRRLAETAAQMERERIDDGRLWIGTLYGSAANSASTPNLRPVDLTAQRRIVGTVRFDGRLSVTIELHECEPGSDQCASGGSIQVRDGETVLCSISVGLLQSTDGAASHYRLDWHAHPPERLATHAGKRRLLERLACDGPVPDRNDFRDLLRRAYRQFDDDDGEPAGEDGLERTVVCQIFQAIVHDSTRRQSIYE